MALKFLDLPILPPLPNDNATVEQVAAYHRAHARVVAERNAMIEIERFRLWEADINARETPEQRAAAQEARAKHAQAQADTAVEMKAASVRQLEAARIMATTPQPAYAWTEADLVRSFMQSLLDQGVAPATALGVAQDAARRYRAAYRPAVAFPAPAPAPVSSNNQESQA